MCGPSPVSSMAACSAVKACALRSVGPTMAIRQSRLFTQASARTSTSKALRGTIDPTASSMSGWPVPRARSAGSVPGSAMVMRSAGHGEIGRERGRRRRAGDDDVPGERESGLLQRVEFVLARLGETGLQAQRMVNESDDRAVQRRDQLGRHRAIGQPVGQNDGFGRHARQQALRLGEIGRSGRRKAARQGEMAHATPNSATAP